MINAILINLNDPSLPDSENQHKHIDLDMQACDESEAFYMGCSELESRGFDTGSAKIMQCYHD